MRTFSLQKLSELLGLDLINCVAQLTSFVDSFPGQAEVRDGGRGSVPGRNTAALPRLCGHLAPLLRGIVLVGLFLMQQCASICTPKRIGHRWASKE